MATEIIASLDIGSSGARASAFTTDGRLVSLGRAGYRTYYGRLGWAEQEPRRWWSASLAALARMAAGLPPGAAVRALALTGQCPTYVPLDAQYRPLGRAMIYQDNRATAEARQLEAMLGNARVHAVTGHSVWAFYILPKLVWQRRHQPELFARLRHVAQPTDYVAYHLTGEFATDETHANATLVFDLRRRRWDESLIKAAELDPAWFPGRVLAPWEQVGTLRREAAARTGLPPGLPVIIGAADSQCCCYGVGAVAPETLSEMAGTSTCLNSTVGQPVDDLRVGNYANALPGYYCTEMGLNTSGAALDWLAAVMFGGSARRLAAAERLAAASPPGAEGLLFLPYLSDGERDNPQLKGGFYNLAAGHDRAHLVRAVLEGVAFAIRKRVEILTEAGCRFAVMTVSGGGAASPLWNRIKADVLGLPVIAVSGVDAAELGAAMLGGGGAGVFRSHAEAVAACVPAGETYEPDPAAAAQYAELYGRFRRSEAALEAAGAMGQGGEK